MQKMTHYKTILVTLFSVGPLIKGDTERTPDKRQITYDRILESGESYDRGHVYFTGDSAHHADLKFGSIMELTYYSKNDGGKVMRDYRYVGRLGC